MTYNITPAFKEQILYYISRYHYPATTLGINSGFGSSYINQLIKDRTKTISDERLEKISEKIAEKAMEYKPKANSGNNEDDLKAKKEEILSELLRTVHPDYVTSYAPYVPSATDNTENAAPTSQPLDTALYVTHANPQANFQLSDTIQKLISESVEISFSEQLKRLEEQMGNLSLQTETTQKNLEETMKQIEQIQVPSFNNPSTTLKMVKNTLEQLSDEERSDFCAKLSTLISKYTK